MEKSKTQRKKQIITKMHSVLKIQNKNKEEEKSTPEKTPLVGQRRYSFRRLFQPARSTSAPPSVALQMAAEAAENSAAPLRSVFLGVDVGTGSARAGLFDANGKLLGFGSCAIQIWKEFDCIEQSSTDIWHALCSAVKSACSHANVDGKEVAGIGFAATCSLVAVDSDGSPVTVSWSCDSRRNVIVWMDHRAVKQAERINASNSPVLQYCGGSLSPEMEPPKLLWVKENLKESWSMAFRWMDLSDWLSYRATGDDTRSLCTTVCKWTYLGHAHLDQLNQENSRGMEACGWDDDFWEEIGLGELVDGHHAKIGRSVAFPGHPLGSGLKPDAAQELGLEAGTPVGTSLIDAHAGGVGVLESVPASDVGREADENEAICRRMVLVCGTSTCHMAVSQSKLFIPGVWGPFWSGTLFTMFNGTSYWLTEGGQSATGALLDHIIENHVASPQLANHAASEGTTVYALLNKVLESMMQELNPLFVSALTKDLHVLPDFHGNRSPIADPNVKGMVSGLTLDTDEKQLALLYLATIQSIAYGTRHIIEQCNANGHKIDTLLACGGLAKNPLYIQEHADITGLFLSFYPPQLSNRFPSPFPREVRDERYPVILPRENESVLLGAAILGSVAAKKYPSLHEAMKALNASGQVIHPSKDPSVKKYHDAKYKIFGTFMKNKFHIGQSWQKLWLRLHCSILHR
ncbi:FGGY carbohydrate kinase domain-containing protein [Bienertia sinuspersici]